MVTAEELTVAIKSSGVSETQEDLKGVEGAMDETANSAGKSAEELEGFSQQFKGAMGAAVAALATAAAGLLSQVPIVGEVVSGFGAILDALILKIDKSLRPVLGGFRDDLFEVARDVREAEGVFDAFVIALDGVGQAIQDASVGQLQSEIEDITGVTIPENWLDLGWDIITLDTRNAIDTLKRTVREYPEDFGTFLGSIAPKAGEEYDKIVARTRSFVSNLISEVRSFPSDARTRFTDLAADLNSWAGDLSSDAREWGVGLIESFIQGIRTKLSELREFLGDLRGAGSAVGINVPSVGSPGGGGGGGSSGGGGSGRRRPTNNGGGNVILDGRSVSEDTGRYRADPGRRRGI